MAGEWTYEQERDLILLENKLAKENINLKINLGGIQKKNNLTQDHALKAQRKSMNLMTRQMTAGGGVLGRSMAMLQQVGGMGMQNMQDKKTLKNQGGEFHKDPQERKRFAMLQGSKSVGQFEKLDKIFDKAFGGDSKWNKMFMGKGKMAAAGVGLGAVGAGIGLTSKIIDSSPLMQQMLKLLNFGIMLVLRPIGDFFGMLMRPILILLLRKFIIPFYQTVYPWFMKNANLINDTFAAIGDGTVTVTKAIAESAKVLLADISKTFDDLLRKYFPHIIPPEANAEETVKGADDILPDNDVKVTTTTVRNAADNILEDVAKVVSPRLATGATADNFFGASNAKTGDDLIPIKTKIDPDTDIKVQTKRLDDMVNTRTFKSVSPEDQIKNYLKLFSEKTGKALAASMTSLEKEAAILTGKFPQRDLDPEDLKKNFNMAEDPVTFKPQSEADKLMAANKAKLDAQRNTGNNPLNDLGKTNTVTPEPSGMNARNNSVLNRSPFGSNTQFKPLITGTQKVTNAALKTIKIIDRIAGLPAEIAIKATKKLWDLGSKGFEYGNNKMRELDKVLTGGLNNKIADATSNTLKKVTNPVTSKIAEKTAILTSKLAFKSATRLVPIAGQIALLVDGLGTAVQAIAPEQYTALNKGIRAGGEALGIPDWVTEGALDLGGWGERTTGQQIGDLTEMGINFATDNSLEKDKQAGGSWWNPWGGSPEEMANGGMIREPIRGVGKSGKNYLLGEAGHELVTPTTGMRAGSTSSGSGGVTINVTVNGSIYSDRDMLNFQRTIMRAIETSSTRKARL